MAFSTESTTEMTNMLTEKLETAAELSSEISDKAADLETIDFSIPSNMFGTLKPTPPKLPIIFFTNPFTEISFTEPDASDIDISSSSSLINTVMKSVSTILSSIIDIAHTAISQAIRMLVQVVENVVVPLWDWIKQTAKDVNKAIGDTYNDWKNNKRAAEDVDDKSRVILWERAINWLNTKWAAITSILASLWSLIGNFIDFIKTTKDSIMVLLGGCIREVSSWSSDTETLTKAATEVFS